MSEPMSQSMNEPTHEQWWQDVECDPIHAAAADWFARLQNPQVSLEETLSWQRWVRADARHAAAFARMEELEHALADITRPHVDDAMDLVTDNYDGRQPIAEWRATTAATNRSHAGKPAHLRFHRLRMAAAVGSVAVALGWCIAERDTLLWTLAGGESIETRIGENRSLRLSDGSRVMLGGDSILRYKLSKAERRMELTQGEAFFTVAKDTVRPFSVRAGSTTVTALGTEFNVHRGADRTVIAVLEGRVAVQSNTKPATQLRSNIQTAQHTARNAALRLSAGEQTTVDAQGIAQAMPLANPMAATGWQTGQLTFRRESLRHVLEDVNRYSDRPIVLEDSALGDLAFTGTVFDNNIQGWIESLENVFGLKSIQEGGRIVLQKNAASPQ